MLTLLLGPDDFTKKEYIADLGKGAQVVFFHAEDPPPSADVLSEQDLFGGAKVFVLYGGLEKFSENDLSRIIDSKNHAFLVQEKLDKRSSFAKSILSNKKVEVKEFPLPHGRELDKWVIDRVKLSGGSITPAAAALLARRVGRDESVETKFGGKVVEVKEIFTLWQINNEISKLVALAGKGTVTEDHVTELVPENREVDTLSIVNAMGEGKKDETIALIQEFLNAGTGSDEKSAIIQLNALLSESFRGILMVKDFTSQGVPESEILNKTGWKSGRLFVVKKIAARFPEPKVKDFLNKLSALDEELKTSSTPPRVLLDLIITQLF